MTDSLLSVLIVDDDDGARIALRHIVERAGPVSIREASNAASAAVILAEGGVSVALIDLRLSRDPRNRDGLELIQKIRASGSETIPVVVSGAGDRAELRAAMRAGAFDYILKDDLSEELILPILHGLREKQALTREVLRLRSRRDPDALSRVVGTSSAMQQVRSIIQRVVTAQCPVLVTGPTGAGKEVVVRCIHALGAHPDQPFIAVNCGGLSESLIDSQLFGHEKGAFTGATHRHEGSFAAAGKGTLFLDELAELPLAIQAKLLRALESGEFQALGASKSRVFEGRIVAATHANLRQRVDEGKFREDLFYRFNVLRIKIPPLSSRREDIPALLTHLGALHKRPLSFTPEAIEVLSQAPWPGNVREMRNLIDRLAVFAPESRITPEMLASIPDSDDESVPNSAVDGFVHEILQHPGADKLQLAEDLILEKVLRLTNGNKTAAACLLGVDRKVVERRVRRADGSSRRVEDEDLVHRSHSSPLGTPDHPPGL